MSTQIENLPNGNMKVTIPIVFHVKGGRKVIVVAEENADAPVRESQGNYTDKTIIAAIARANEWQKMIDSGEFASGAELAARIGVSSSYITRMLRLNNLSPKIVYALLIDNMPSGFSLTKIFDSFPDSWDEQYEHFGFNNS
jgi:ParB-like chromosome segregation protein Spo0J